MDLGLQERVVIVAASSEGIARAAADRFAEEGARLAMCSRDGEKLSRAVNEIRARHGAEVLAEPVDVTDAVAVQRFVDYVAEQFGGVDAAGCLRDPKLRKQAAGKGTDNQRDLRDGGNRSAPPPKYRDLFDAFRKGAARSSP